ncbi:MAG: type II secretion system protein [Pseudomonadota bacterium]|nr:type II secretion system protein [Pseudomonadota bacterium]
MRAGNRGFTLIELLVVLGIVALLLTLAGPRYFQHIQTAKETALHENLQSLRRVIDAYYEDLGRYPESIEEMVQKQYLRAIPKDPITDSTKTWTTVPVPDGYEGSVYDVKSGAPGSARDGTLYSEW